MGMFDSVFVTCPQCGEEVEFQSKGGPCEMQSIRDLSNVPIDIASRLGRAEWCDCGNVVNISVPKTVYIQVLS